MSDVTAFAQRYVDVWNEADSGRRHQLIRDLWAVDGMECTKARLTKGHADLEARITASHEKNVRDAGNRFLLPGSDRNNEIVKLEWKMICVEDGLAKATGSYVLRVNEHNKYSERISFPSPERSSIGMRRGNGRIWELLHFASRSPERSHSSLRSIPRRGPHDRPRDRGAAGGIVPGAKRLELHGADPSARGNGTDVAVSENRSCNADAGGVRATQRKPVGAADGLFLGFSQENQTPQKW